MEIEIIKYKENKDFTINFAKILNSTLQNIKLLHWYSSDINIHNIFDELYSSLNKKFDRLQEEIIETSKNQNITFPSFNFELFNINIEYITENEIKNIFNSIISKFLNVLNSMEFNNYIKTVNSGLLNTKDEILSSINKSKYLISMVKI